MGQVSEAFEAVETPGGRLYDCHRLCGAVDQLQEAGHEEVAELLRRELVARNVLEGRWSFQIVEKYDHDQLKPFRDLEERARVELLVGRRHVYESEMKQERRTHGHPNHTSRPQGREP